MALPYLREVFARKTSLGQKWRISFIFSNNKVYAVEFPRNPTWDQILTELRSLTNVIFNDPPDRLDKEYNPSDDTTAPLVAFIDEVTVDKQKDVVRVYVIKQALTFVGSELKHIKTDIVKES